MKRNILIVGLIMGLVVSTGWAQESQDRGRDWGRDRGRDGGRDWGRDRGRDRGSDFGRDRGQDSGRDRGRDYGRDRGSDSSRDRGRDYGRDGNRDSGDRERRGPDMMFGMNSESIERHMDDRIRHDIDRMADAYDMTDEQVDTLRDRMSQLRDQWRQYMDSTRPQREQQMREIRDLFQRRQAGEEVDRDRMHELFSQMGSIWRDSPMSYRRVEDELAGILPPAQFAKGQDRIRRRFQEMEQQRDSERWLDEVRRGRQSNSAQMDGWDRYVGQFVRQYQLDSSQQATAQSILRSVKQERDTYRNLVLRDYQEALNIEDSRIQRDRIRKLDEPVNRLFEKLKTQLDRVPTAAQKLAFGPKTDVTVSSREESRDRQGDSSADNTSNASQPSP